MRDHRLKFKLPSVCTSKIRLVVRMGTRINVLTYCNNTVLSVQENIESRIGIQVFEQELYFKGKKLLSDSTLKECSVIDSGAELKLVDRRQARDIKQNPSHKKGWEELYDFIFLIDDIMFAKARDGNLIIFAKECLSGYLGNMPEDDVDKAEKYIKIFTSSAALDVLIKLCRSNFAYHELCAMGLISILLKEFPLRVLTVPILLKLCSVFGHSSHEYDLYYVSQSILGDMMGDMKVSSDRKTKNDIPVQNFVGILKNLVINISLDLTSDGTSKTRLNPFCPSRCDVTNLKICLMPMKSLSKDALANYGEEDITNLEKTLSHLLGAMNICLRKMEQCLAKSITNVGCYEHIVLLHELQNGSQLFQSIENKFWSMLRLRKISFCNLIIKFGRRTDNYEWIYECKDITTFECRRCLANLLFPKLKDDVELHEEMIINRSQLLEESLEYIIHANIERLQAGLSIKFNDEVATGPGVLREWFCLVCKALFDHDFFLACPDNPRRYFPNPTSKHLQYFKFAGRLIALVLMHNVQVGIYLDRVFYLQLAEKSLSLEDIQYADPRLYRSYKQILEMDPKIVDQDALSLSFMIEEIDELGSRRDVELVEDGKNISVNSTNREKFIDLLVQHRFVISVAEQVAHFTKGFNDIINSSRKRKLFFQSLEMEDLDGMLHGRERDISVDDWKAHTRYIGYDDNDPEIVWFWKVVKDMSPEQRKVLLFFWTSLKFLPVEGFRGLSSLLHIHRADDTSHRLPSAHTCFYQLRLPPYPSFKVMQDRLHMITQEHIACSFGIE